MNTVLLKINSYAQTAQMFINGQEPSVYSEIANFTYSQYIQKPDDILDAVARELNDDFSLSILGNEFETQLFMEAAGRSDYCFESVPATKVLDFSTWCRAEQLADLLPQQEISVCVTGMDIPEEVNYGRIALKFSRMPSDQSLSCVVRANEIKISISDMMIALTTATPRELVISACETLLINPMIGRAVAKSNSDTSEVVVCERLEPIVAAEMPQVIESDTRAPLDVTIYPASSEMPTITVTSSNTDVVMMDGATIVAMAPGAAIIQAYIAGENKPFFSQNVTVTKTIRAKEIQILSLDDAIHEGDVIPLHAAVLPADAVDAKELVWETSDLAVAEVKDGCLHVKNAGSCVIKASATCASAEMTITAAPRLRQMKISAPAITTSVGRKAPVSIRCIPENAYNADYIWKSSDESVAVIEQVDGQEYVKAVGIGNCTLTCTSLDGSIFDTCNIVVKSMMYKNEKNAFFSPASIAIFAALAYLIFRILFG